MNTNSMSANDCSVLECIVINKCALLKLGIYPALLLGELASERDRSEQKGKLVDGMFCSTIKSIQSSIGLSRYQQDEAISKLKEFGILEVVLKGMPQKRYFKLNVDKLEEALYN